MFLYGWIKQKLTDAERVELNRLRKMTHVINFNRNGRVVTMKFLRGNETFDCEFYATIDMQDVPT